MFDQLTLTEKLTLSAALGSAYQACRDERSRLDTFGAGRALATYGVNGDTYREVIDDLLAVRYDVQGAAR